MQTPNETADNGAYTPLTDIHSQITSEEPDETPTDEPLADDKQEEAEPLPKALLEGEDQDEASDDGDELPELDPVLKENPDIARRWEEHQKGVQKLVDRNKAKESELDGKIQSVHTLIEVGQRLLNPETTRAEFATLRQQIIEQTGIDPLSAEDGQDEDTPSKYGLDYKTDDKVAETAVKLAEQQFEKRFGKSIDYVEKLIAKEEAAQTAASHVTKLQDTFGAWVTPDLVVDAINKYPNLPIDAAFGAAHAKRITKETESYVKRVTRSDNGQQSRKVVKGGDKTEAQTGAKQDWSRGFTSIHEIHAELAS
jgi:hypothetical protein